MEINKLKICSTEYNLYGCNSDKVFIYLCLREKANIIIPFAEMAQGEGWQTLVVNLSSEDLSFPQIKTYLTNLLTEVKIKWKYSGVYAGGICSFISLLAFSGTYFSKVMYVSPLISLNKETLPLFMDELSSYEDAEDILRSYIDPCEFIVPLHASTEILYSGHIPVKYREELEKYAKTNKWGTACMEEADYHFASEEEIKFLEGWQQALLFMPICTGGTRKVD